MYYNKNNHDIFNNFPGTFGISSATFLFARYFTKDNTNTIEVAGMNCTRHSGNKTAVTVELNNVNIKKQYQNIAEET